MTTIIMTIIILGVFVLVHELGHFLAARAADVRVYEFSVGFGPQLMQPELEEEEEPTEGRGFREKGYLPRAVFFAAGSGMNFVAAIVLFFLVFGIIGIQTGTLVVDELQPGLPAEHAGLEPGDRIVGVNGEPVADWAELVSIIQAHPGDELAFNVVRGGQELTLVVTPVARGEDGMGYIGLAPVFERVRMSLPAALARGIQLTEAIIANFVTALMQVFQGQGGPEFIGVVGIGAEIGEASRLGLANLIFFSAVLSVSLGLINLLPIPALDGSHLLFLLVERLRGKPVDPEKENLIHFVGFALLMLLAVFITYRDILRLI